MQIPAEWQAVLKQVQVKYPSAIIAGGALRDLEYGKPVKDVDIFIPVNDYDEYAIRGLFRGTGGITVRPVLETWYQDGNAAGHPTESEDYGRTIYGVFKLDGYQYDYDLIVGDERAADISTFDFSICQIGYNGSVINRTAIYEQTRITSEIYVVNARPPKRYEERVARISDKFPEYPVKQVPNIDEAYPLG